MNSLFDKKEFSINFLPSGAIEGFWTVHAILNFELEKRVVQNGGHIGRDTAMAVAKLKTLITLGQTCRANNCPEEAAAAFWEAAHVMKDQFTAWDYAKVEIQKPTGVKQEIVL